MSGGVDSSVTAALLAHQHKFDLEGVFMRNWDTADDDTRPGGGCQWEKDWGDVQRVCRALGIKARMVDLSKEYWTRVFEPSLKAWEKGWTPNPDVWCNKEVKFGALLDRLVQSHDSTTEVKPWLATGHYARKDYHPYPPLLYPAHNPPHPHPQLLPRLLRHPSQKDQTYYLASIPLPSLQHTIFPLGNPPPLSLSLLDSLSSPSRPAYPRAHEDQDQNDYVNREKEQIQLPQPPPLTKTQVRHLAKKWGLHSALAREESMGICFVGERSRFGEFVSQYIPPTSGPIISLPTGVQLGTHKGLWNYTIGQRARVSGCVERLFVVRKSLREGGIVWVAPGDHPSLFTRSLTSTDFTWIWPRPPDEIWNDATTTSNGGDSEKGLGTGMKARVKIRHVGATVGAWVQATTTPNSDAHTLKITFETPQKAVSPGQIAVVYDESGEWCLGCGTIEDTACLG